MPNHILSTRQFTDRGLLEEIFSEAKRFQDIDHAPDGKSAATRKLQKDARRAMRQILDGDIVATVFYEPSTRTRFSFEAATQKLGGQLLTSESAGQFSSAIKGETIEDSIRVIAGYANMIVLRHPEIGAAEKAARVSPVPIINAGDGAGEHPTQALLDLYTIQRELETIDNLRIALVGDLLYGRTIHSLTQLLEVAKDPHLYLVSPEQLRLPGQYRAMLKAKGIQYTETADLSSILPEVDVVYMTRIQKERFGNDIDLYNKIKDSFIMGPEEVDRLRDHSILMHPLPRVNEISAEVDASPKAAYFRQAQNGLYVRMSLLSGLAEATLDLPFTPQPHEHTTRHQSRPPRPLPARPADPGNPGQLDGPLHG